MVAARVQCLINIIDPMVTDSIEAPSNHHSFMMMPKLLSGKPRVLSPIYARPTSLPLQLSNNQENYQALLDGKPYQQDMLHPIIVIL